MSFPKTFVLLFAVTGGLFADVPILLHVQVVPSVPSFNAGQTITVETIVSGLAATGATEVGSFDIFIGYDTLLVTPLAVTFGPLLGDPSLVEALTDFRFQPGVVEMAEVSLLTNAELHSLQADMFSLASITFQALQSGASNFQFSGGPIDDGNGILIGGTKEVPEPDALVLLCPELALVFLLVWLSRKHRSAQACFGLAPVGGREPAGTAGQMDRA